ncbi:MAG TPA: 3-phosphoserine/phosphohydroxythreonine transaminase [Anaerolineaceae bacterium]|jgi:phosphoserine aminotransferase|nr:3-phosphoserine/phosphohydroxythreonine transaminase [Chloroflexota bacterium]HNZ01127.1 3-phosphoserine/phosphohydroxythreonine transaminase [Anaerolineaceae bacterium]HOH20418.1 3-phosphoserine/phosphohydroxythreonine transaminase [Anaerolineaceae bacterium]HQL38714.1 3-phosphoserine/phosphohydroxythreonine transaminase [Anaerolineaceae bacterium]HQO97445.1 3-phosphoserine/phosphohydroxythreonine transaminase [Anaerolineaceae bacterium]
MSPKRVHNFNAGPSILPVSVLEKAQAELLDYAGCGMSVMEMSHRSKEFEGIIQTAEADLRELMGIPANYKIVFVQGGATLNFAMIPMNFRPAGTSADYIVTGAWSKTANKEASKLGATKLAFTSEAENFTRLPAQEELVLDPSAAYLHFCHNETIHGVEFRTEPVAPAGVPLICDMSSDFLSQPVDVTRYDMIYAGAQKNAGPAGVVVCIIKEDLLARVPEKMPALLDYRLLAESGSLHNTPPCWSIYMVGLVFKWLKDLGGLPAVYKLNQEKADLIYGAIDASGGYYRGHAKPEARSIMNVPFRMQSEELEDLFVKEAKKADFIGLKGHRSVGGLRASIYNALPIESAKALAVFMADFQKAHG